MAPSVEGFAAYIRRPVSQVKALLESKSVEVQNTTKGIMHNFAEQIEHYFPTDSGFEQIIQATANDIQGTRVIPIEEVRTQAKELAKNIF
jgi:hypothetical protein